MLKQLDSRYKRQLDLPLGAESNGRLFDSLEAFSIFDFSKPVEAYDLGHQICVKGQKLSNTFFWYSDVPIVVKLSTKFMEFSRDNLQDVLQYGKMKFQAVQAEGTKNRCAVSRRLMPVVDRITAGEYYRLRQSGGFAEIVARNFSLKPTFDCDPNSYILNFSEDTQDRLEYLAYLQQQRTAASGLDHHHA